MNEHQADIIIEQNNNLEQTLGTSVEAQAKILEEQRKATKHLETMSSSVREAMSNNGDEMVQNFFKLFKGEKGRDGRTPTQEELRAIIKPLIPPPPKNGKDGKDGRDGKDAKEVYFVSKTEPESPKKGDVWIEV